MRKLQIWNPNFRFINPDALLPKKRVEIFGSKSHIISEKGFDIKKNVRQFFSFLDIFSPTISHPEKDISQTVLTTQPWNLNTLAWQSNSITEKKTDILLGKIISRIPKISPEENYKIVSDSLTTPHVFNDSKITDKGSWQRAMKDLLFNKGIISHLKNTLLLEYYPTHIKQIYNKLGEQNHIKTILDGFHYRISKRLKGFFSKSAHLKIFLKDSQYYISKSLDEFFSKYIFLEWFKRNDKNINQLVFNTQEAFSTKGPLVPRHIYYSDLIYFSPGKSPASSDPVQIPRKEETIEHKKDISSYETRRTASQGMPEINMYNLTDKVYRLIFERIRREKELRGH